MKMKMFATANGCKVTALSNNGMSMLLYKKIGTKTLCFVPQSYAFLLNDKNLERQVVVWFVCASSIERSGVHGGFLYRLFYVLATFASVAVGAASE